MGQEEFDRVESLPGREDISLVKRKGDEYWQMMNSDGDVWGKFYTKEDHHLPDIYYFHKLTEGKAPVRVYHEGLCKYVDPNTGYVSDGSYHDQSGHYRNDYGHINIPVRKGFRPEWYFRSADGNCSKRVFLESSDYFSRDYNFASSLIKGSLFYYERCFETNGKIKPLFDLEALHTSDEGISLLREDIERPINNEVKYSRYVSLPLYFYRDRSGELSESFYSAWPYNNGWARVQKWYRAGHSIQYRDTKGNLSRPFYKGTDYKNGYAVVCIEVVERDYHDREKITKGRYCIRDIEGNLSTKWFESEYEALKEIELGNAKTYFEKRILDKKVDEEKLKSYYFVDEEDKCGFRLVQKYIGGDLQFVDKDGNLSEPYYSAYGCRIKRHLNSSGFQVRNSENGNLSQEVYYVDSPLYVHDKNGCKIVQLKANGPYYLMDRDGNMSDPFGEINCTFEGFNVVQKSFYHPYQIMDKNWRLSQKKYPDKESAEADIKSAGFVFVGEDTPTIKPRPKKVIQNSNKSQTIEAIASMLGESDAIKADDEQSSKTDLER